MYENKKILILGAARSGIAVANLLLNKNNDITLSDVADIPSDVKVQMQKSGVHVVIGNQLPLLDEHWDLIVRNPAIKFTSPLMQKMIELNLRVENEMEVAYHFLPKNVKIIGVTGSNGKTTTTTIIYELLKRLGVSVVLGGNIGTPLSFLEVSENDYLLLEISDHQLLDFCDFKTDVSVLTNLSPTHLDYHGTYEHYMNAKKNIFRFHTHEDIAILNNKDKDSMMITTDIESCKVYFNDEKNYFDETGIYIENKLVVSLKDILLKGQHNYENILAALLVVKTIAWDEGVIRDFLKNFGGVEHRLEFVRQVNDVLYYNDSKATNPVATITALKTFSSPIHLILGGEERGQDFNELNPYMKYVTCIYAIGSVTNRVVEYAKSQNIEYVECHRLAKALEVIPSKVHPNDVVLLSTASASQDQYARFEDRGCEFKNFVAKL